MIPALTTAVATAGAVWLLATAVSPPGRAISPQTRPARALLWTRAAVTVVLLAHAARGLFYDVRHATPREWDFLCFWTWGRMAALGLDFYSPASGIAFATGRSSEFIEEILGVGPHYPPQAVLWMLPLGYFEPDEALLGWTLFQLAALSGALVAIWRLVGSEGRWLGFGAVSAFVLAHPAIRGTLFHGQTNFLVLLLVALLLSDHARPRAGIWAALGMVVKPYVAVVAGVLVALRRGQALWWTGGVSVALALVSAGVFGPDRFVTYVTNNPSARAPAFVLSESVNQSLSATLIRWTHHEQTPSDGQLRGLIALAILAFATPVLWTLVRLDRRAPLLSGSLLLSLALVCYPGTLAHYSVMLVIPLLVLWNRLPRSYSVCALLVAIPTVCALRDGTWTFWANVGVLVCLSVEAWREIRARGALPATEG